MDRTGNEALMFLLLWASGVAGLFGLLAMIETRVNRVEANHGPVLGVDSPDSRGDTGRGKNPTEVIRRRRRYS
jgi:hypothetical protein